MSKVKNYIIGGLFVFLAILAIQMRIKSNRITALSSENDRLNNNIEQLLVQNKSQTSLVLTQQEWLRVSADSIQTLLKQLKIRPKQVIKYVEREVKQVIRDTVQVESKYLEGLMWHITDTGKCHRVELDAELDGLDLNARRTLFEYNNRSTDIYYWTKKKFLFIPIGKKQFFQKHIPECGTESVREITIIKK